MYNLWEDSVFKEVGVTFISGGMTLREYPVAILFWSRMSQDGQGLICPPSFVWPVVQFILCQAFVSFNWPVGLYIDFFVLVDISKAVVWATACGLMPCPS